MTFKEAEKNHWSDIDIAWMIMNGVIEPEPREYRHPVHGKVVGTRFDPYHDVMVYEDGYEEKYYIGD